MPRSVRALPPVCWMAAGKSHGTEETRTRMKYVRGLSQRLQMRVRCCSRVNCCVRHILHDANVTIVLFCNDMAKKDGVCGDSGVCVCPKPASAARISRRQQHARQVPQSEAKRRLQRQPQNQRRRGRSPSTICRLSSQIWNVKPCCIVCCVFGGLKARLNGWATQYLPNTHKEMSCLVNAIYTQVKPKISRTESLTRRQRTAKCEMAPIASTVDNECH
ncbi:hypothetical protein ACQKWADRAFT_266385 [Trichoderma austrokoningii]